MVPVYTLFCKNAAIQIQLSKTHLEDLCFFLYCLSFGANVWTYVTSHPGLSLSQSGCPFVGKCNEYQPKHGNALRLWRKRQVWFMCVWQVKLC